MEKAKQKSTEIQAEMLNSAEPSIDALKPEINNLLQTFLPGKITIEEAEILAMVIFDIIIHPNDYLLSAVKPDREGLQESTNTLAREFFEKQGIGSGTNITTHMVKCLLKDFLDEYLQSSPEPKEK